MLTRLSRYLKPPVFPGDEDKTFTASLLHVILWSLLVGICLYTFVASVFALIQPPMLPIAWLYVFALGAFSMVLMMVMRRGYVRAAAIAVSVGLWIILTIAAYFNGGVAAPAYGGYLVVIVCTCLLVSWQGGLVAAFASAAAGVFFLRVELPDWLPTYTFEAVWSATIAYFFVTTMLLALALHAIKRASQQMRQEAAVRAKAEQALDRSEQRFRAIFNSVNDAIFVQDLNEGRILEVNQKMCEMYGFTGEEACAQTIGDLSAGDAPYTQQEAIAWMKKTAGGVAQVFEWLCKDRQGRLFWVEVNMRRAALDGQERLLVVVRNIDDRKQTEAVLRREQAYYEAIVNATPVMLWLKDTANRTLHLNPAAARLEGLVPADLEGRSAYELYPREQAEAFYRDDLEVIHSGQPKFGIIEQHTAAGTGQIMWVETGKVPVRDDQGNIVGVLACAVDITERKVAAQVEAATRQIAEAALMTQNLDEFYQSIYGIISPLIPASNFYVALYDAATDRFSVPYLRDEFDAEWPPYPPGQGLNAYVMRSGEPLLATPEVFAALEQQGQVQIINRRMAEWLGVPLKTPQGPLGVMAVQNYAGPARLTESHKDLLVFVSAQVAMAIERKRAEQRLQLKEESLRLALAAARMGTWDWQVATDHWSWSDNVKEMFGWNAGETVRTYADYLALLAAEDRQRVVDALTQALAGEDDHLLVEHRVRWPDQSVHWVESRGQVFRDAQGHPARVAGTLADVTERKHIEAELAHERDLLQSLMDNFPDTIYFKDRASRFTRVNRAQASMLGATIPEEAVGKTDADFFNTALNEMFVAEEQRLMATGEPIFDRVEYNPTPAGQPRWLSASKVPLRDASGQIVGLVGISRDITDRILADQREKTISQGLRAVIEATQELIDCADLDTLYRRSVELAREKLGLERSGLSLLDEAQEYLLGTYGTDGQGVTTDERAARSRIEVSECNELFASADRLWTVLDGSFIYWQGDTPQSLLGSGWMVATPIRSRRQNIGLLYNDTALTHAPLEKTQQEVVAVYCSLLGSLIELKRTEAALTHERDLLQSLMDSTPDNIYFKDTASRFLRVNRQTAAFFGAAAPEDVIGKTDQDYQAAELAQMFLAEEQEMVRTGQPVIDRVEYNPASDGRPRWLATTKVPLRDPAGQIYGLAGVSRDVTERMLAQQRDQMISQGLRAVIEAADELINCSDLDALYRRAVELAREKLKVERCGLFTLDEQGWLRGTYGTDLRRQTTVERGAYFQPINLEGLDAASNQLREIIQSEHAYWEGEQQQVTGRGWVGVTFIRTRDHIVGVLYNDTAISQAPIDEAQQEVLAVYGSFLGSLIELKHAEEALRASETLYRRAIEAAGAVPYYLDFASDSYRFMGDGILPLTGVTPAEMRPSLWDTLIQAVYPLGEATATSWREAVQETRAGRLGVWRADYTVLTRDGRSCWMNDAWVQVLDDAGRPRGAIGILQDIADRKRVELALRESQTTMRALLDAIPDAIFRFDTQGVFKDFIPAKTFAALLPPDDFIGRPYDQVLPPAMAQQLGAKFQQVVETGEPRLYEYTLSTDAHLHYYEARLVKMAQGDVLGIVREVTDRKEAELALQQREAYLRSILDNFPYWIWLKDTNGRFLAVNKALADSRGYASSDELVGLSDDGIAARDPVEQDRADDRLAQESRTQKLVEEIVLVQGAERWFETFESPVVDVQGIVIGTAGFAHDITARRQAEAAVRESEMLFRYLAENAPAFIAMTDEHGTATYLNRVWQDFRGSAPGQPVAEWAERVHPDDRRRYLHEFQAALQAQRKFTTEYRLRRSDGQYRWLLDTVVPRFTADERFAGFIGIAIDITDRKNAEEALHRSESRLRLLTDNMVDSISQVDAQLRYVYASPSVERVFGYSPRELLGRSSLELAHQDDEPRLRQHILMATEVRAPSLRLEYRYRHADHYDLWVEAEMRLLYDRPGNFSGAVFSVRDISARKKAETEREQLIHELEDKNAELERFTYTVSHDLKSPLITIRGFLGFLEKDAAAGNLERLRADIARIADATTRMHRLLDEMLELSRIGRVINPSQEVSFESIAREAVELVQGRLMARGVQVEINPDLPIVYGDRLRLVEVVQNLVDNAVKFMGDQVEPRVIIGALGTERAGMPIFFVQDNGIGVEPDYQQRIFGLFNKLDVHSEGTGVGLALVKRIIELHGGYIWVESDGIGRGATFFFTLPRPASSSRKD